MNSIFVVTVSDVIGLALCVIFIGPLLVILAVEKFKRWRNKK
jgi:hypothetical protein